MKTSITVFTGCLLFVTPCFAGVEKYYVNANKLNVRLCPKTSCPATNHVYRGSVVTVYQRSGKWARISKFYDSDAERAEFPQITSATVARWVSFEFLSHSKPSDYKQPVFDTLLMDPRIKGVPKVGEYDLSKIDVTIIRRYAAKLLKAKICSGISYADKSVRKPNTYFVLCTGESRNRFFKSGDL